MSRTGSEEPDKFRYAMLTNKQYAAVLVVDIDRPDIGGQPINLSEGLQGKLFQLASRGLAPAWVGINRLIGKAECLWQTKPVCTDNDGKSSNMALLAATSRTLGGFLDHDPTSAHWYYPPILLAVHGGKASEARAQAGALIPRPVRAATRPHGELG